MCKSVTINDWVVDSGATDHIIPFFSLLEHPRPINAIIHLPNGNTSSSAHLSSITLHSNIKLHNVLCVPTFHYNLLPVSKLTHDNNCSIIFTSTSCVL